MTTRQRKPFRPPKEDIVNSDVEINTENPHFSPPIASTQNYKPRMEVQSNIDGFSQSDLWERDSQGYLDNSRRLLNRLKKNPESEYSKLNIINEIGAKGHVSNRTQVRKSKPQVTTTKMIQNTLKNAPNRNSLDPGCLSKPKKAE